MDAFTTAYIEAMLWAETDEDGEPLDRNYGPEDIAPESLAEITKDCAAFQADNAEDIDGRFEQAGHDFYLTRNRHGAGFWDGDWPEPAAKRLTDAAHAYGTQGLMPDDDGNLYIHG